MNRNPRNTSRQIFQDRCRVHVSATKAAMIARGGGACSAQSTPAINQSITADMPSNSQRALDFSQSNTSSAVSPTGILGMFSQSMSVTAL